MQSHQSIRGRYLTKQDAAEYASFSISYIDRLISKGAIKAIRLSLKMTRIDGDSLAAFFESKSQIPSTPRGKNIKVAGK
jgi:hypothetical protein